MLSAENILLLYLIFFTLELISENVLVFLNLTEIKKNSGHVPEYIADNLTLKEYKNGINYNSEKHWFSFSAGLFSSALVLFLILSGALAWIEQTP